MHSRIWPLAAAVALVGGSACSGPHDAEALDSEESSFVGTVEQAVYGTGSKATFGAFMIVVNQTPCSAVFLNNHIFLTAAHCLPTRNNASYPTNLWYYEPGGNGLNRIESIFFYVHPDYTGEGDWDHDIAVGASSSSFGLSTKNFVQLSLSASTNNVSALYAGYGETASGRGDHFTPRRIFGRLSDIRSSRFTWSANQVGQGLCDGDSGGPWLRDSGLPLDRVGGPVNWSLQGLAVATQGPPDGDCGAYGKGTRVVDKYDWILNKVEAWPVSGAYTCTRRTTRFGEPVARCWD